MNLAAGRMFRKRLSILAFFSLGLGLKAEQIPLQALVTPSTIIVKDGKPVKFALHGFVEFESLSEAFAYIDAQARRWPQLKQEQRRTLAGELLRRAIESRVVSMADERPLETITTHTSEELRQALAYVKESTPPGYAEDFLAVQEKWKHSLNCWSAASSIHARVLSNWYPIAEGIELYGATYDSTEHFWQAVKFHPEVTVADLQDLLAHLQRRDWKPWLARLDADPGFYLPNAYAVEFLRHNLDAQHHFDAVYLQQHKMDFMSEDFRSLMLEIWRVKYLKMARFREVIASIPLEIHLSHFLNDGDSPDIPVPVYIEYLNQIRLLARNP